MCDRSYDEVVFDILKIEPEDFAVSTVLLCMLLVNYGEIFIMNVFTFVIYFILETNYSYGYSCVQSYKTRGMKKHCAVSHTRVVPKCAVSHTRLLEFMSILLNANF